jgi:acyl-CoA synthetase (AMP-forming)/AMP-acid ligase II
MKSPSGVNMNISTGIREFATSMPRQVAITDGSRSVTYLELEDRVRRVANMLLAAGLQIGDRVSLVCGNRWEYPEVAAGCARAGMVLVPINPRLTAPEVGYQVSHSGSRAVIFDAALADSVTPSLEGTDLALTLAIDGGGSAPDYESALDAARSVDPDIWVPETSPFCIAYTSGTTGRPKGPLISHRSRCLTFYFTAIEWGLGPGRRTIAVAPLYHGAGFAFAYAALHTGGTVSMLRHFDSEELISMIGTVGAQTIFLVPTHAQMLRALGDDVIRRANLESLETLYFNAAPMPQELKLWLLDVFPKIRLHECYGSTEAGVVTNLRPEDQLRKDACVGPPWFMTQLRVVDPDGQPVEPGVKGELYSRSPFLMNGYLNDDAGTEACTTPDGFLTSGDVATLDEDGYVYILDRTKDMIVSGGVNVYPREIEEVLSRHPDVADIAVVGSPSSKWGEQVTAFIVLAKGSEVDINALEDYCRTALAGFKIPRDWRVVQSLPRNASGKVLKTTLRQLAETDSSDSNETSN